MIERPTVPKIDVITLHAVKNYGSVLQTYATQEKLRQLGCDVEVIDYWRRDNLDENLLSLHADFHAFPMNVIARPVLYPTIRRWQKVFNGFLSRRINLTSRRYLSNEELVESLPEADAYCTGSDQTWNSTLNGGILPAYYLAFVPDDKPKFSYAASIGNTEIDPNEARFLASQLSRYEMVSVREQSAVDLLGGLGIDAQCVLDPTLAMGGGFWSEFADDEEVGKEGYVLLYRLHPDRFVDDFAVEYAKRHKLKLRRVCLRYDQVRECGSPIFIPEVEELVGLIKGASMVVTDSFHVSAFSVMLERNFAVYCKGNFNTRIDNLLNICGLRDRWLSPESRGLLLSRDANFDGVADKLDAARGETDRFLMRAVALAGKGF